MSETRVRFAPSPTGRLHVGGARTALFNWLFARRTEGVFIVRSEDTDSERSNIALEEEILRDLAWLGLEWDEGPGKGGAAGPYRQTERVEIYREYADRLVRDGHAYSCFCTDEELEQRRADKRRAGKPPHYDGACRELTTERRELLRREDRPESIRFIVPDGEQGKLDDLIRGEVVFPPGMVGDFVVMRSNGLPTYNFAAAVDDALMRITHVIRGEEHLSNTLRQLMVYEALGFEAPTFAHIPLILGPDRSKLSKRHGAPNVADFRERGYPADGIVNYLAFLGWSPSGEREIFSVEELIGEFTLERVSSSASIFDTKKLDWVCAQHVRAGGPAVYFEEAAPFFPDTIRERYNRETLVRIFRVVSENLPCFTGLPGETVSFEPGPAELGAEAIAVLSGAAETLAALLDELRACEPWEETEIVGAVKRAGKRSGAKGKGLFMPLRLAVTGLSHGPALTTVLAVRGRDDVTGALERAINEIGEG